MRIELENLEENGGRFAQRYGAEELELQDDRVRLKGAAEIEGGLTRDAKQVTAAGRISAQVEVDCDRCLKPVSLPIDAKFLLHYVTPEEYQTTQAAELEEEDMDLSVYVGEVIDVDEIAREQILLAVPERVLCHDECKGICPVCGVDRNLKSCDCESAETDPRWAALKNLQL